VWTTTTEGAVAPENQAVYYCWMVGACHSTASHTNALCTVFDLRQHNDNTIKDVTPFLDQDTIQHNMAQAKFQSKLDLTEVYEQICVKIKDIPKTAFTTIVELFISNILKIG
jgi:hypothetical protein